MVVSKQFGPRSDHTERCSLIRVYSDANHDCVLWDVPRIRCVQIPDKGLMKQRPNTTSIHFSITSLSCLSSLQRNFIKDLQIHVCLQKGHWQAEQTQLRRHRTRHLNKVCTACMQNLDSLKNRKELISLCLILRSYSLVPVIAEHQGTPELMTVRP